MLPSLKLPLAHVETSVALRRRGSLMVRFGYDPNSNLLSVSDAKTPAGFTTYAYENMDRLQSRTDPLLKTESRQYDLAKKLIPFRDRKVPAAMIYEYDALNRTTKATYADNSFTK